MFLLGYSWTHQIVQIIGKLFRRCFRTFSTSANHWIQLYLLKRWLEIGAVGLHINSNYGVIQMSVYQCFLLFYGLQHGVRVQRHLSKHLPSLRAMILHQRSKYMSWQRKTWAANKSIQTCNVHSKLNYWKCTASKWSCHWPAHIAFLNGLIRKKMKMLVSKQTVMLTLVLYICSLHMLSLLLKEVHRLKIASCS